MIRVDNWQNLLTSLIIDRRDEPYDIVKFNCLKWACEAIQVQTEQDFYAKFDNSFSNEIGAAKILRSVGNSTDTTQYLESILGERQSLAFIRKGDIVVANVPADYELIVPSNVDLFGPCIGVCYGRQSYFVGIDGLVEIETLSLGAESYGFHC